MPNSYQIILLHTLLDNKIFRFKNLFTTILFLNVWIHCLFFFFEVDESWINLRVPFIDRNHIHLFILHLCKFILFFKDYYRIKHCLRINVRMERITDVLLCLKKLTVFCYQQQIFFWKNLQHLNLFISTFIFYSQMMIH